MISTMENGTVVDFCRRKKTDWLSVVNISLQRHFLHNLCLLYYFYSYTFTYISYAVYVSMTGADFCISEYYFMLTYFSVCEFDCFST